MVGYIAMSVANFDRTCIWARCGLTSEYHTHRSYCNLIYLFIFFKELYLKCNISNNDFSRKINVDFILFSQIKLTTLRFFLLLLVSLIALLGSKKISFTSKL